MYLFSKDSLVKVHLGPLDFMMASIAAIAACSSSLFSSSSSLTLTCLKFSREAHIKHSSILKTSIQSLLKWNKIFR